MKVVLQYVVHSVHDTEMMIDAEVKDGPLAGRKVAAPVPALVVELVPAEGTAGRTITLDIVTASPEEHAEALARFGFGATVSVTIDADGKGMTPARVAAAAKAEHEKAAAA